MSDVPLPQPDAYEYLIANVWRTETHFNGVKAKEYRCLYATEKVHAHAAAVSADLAAKNAKLKTVMIAAAEEIKAHWDAHCDADGYGPLNLMRRLEEGIPSQYGYTAGRFAELERERDALRQQLALAETVRASQVAGLVEGADKLREEVKRLTKIIDDAWGEA
jgi:hypothetical protein